MNINKTSIYFLGLVFLFFTIAIYGQDTVRPIDLGPDTTICEGEYLLVGNNLYTDTCNTSLVWWDGTISFFKQLFETGTYWVDVQSLCGNYSDTVHVDVIQCDPGCGTYSQLSGRYGSGMFNQFAACMAPIPDGSGIYVTGTILDSIFIAKVNLIGEIEWINTFLIVDGRNHISNAIIVDSDGMIAMAITSAPNLGDVSCNVVRFDPLIRQILWARQYPLQSFDKVNSLILDSSDGNYLTSTNRHGVFKINHFNGDLIDVGSGATGLSSVTFQDMVIKEGFLYGAGGVLVDNDPSPRFLLSKIRLTDGQEIWSRYGDSLEIIGGRHLAPDLTIIDNFIYAIYSDKDQILHVLKSDLNGNLTWLKKYDIPGFKVDANEIISTANGFIVMSEIYSTHEIVLMKINLDGELIWNKSLITAKQLHVGVQADEAVGQILELNQNLFYTTRSEFTEGNKSQILIARLTLEGDPLSSCLYYRTPRMEWATENNPLFIPFNVQKTKVVINSIPRLSQLRITSVEPQPACFFSNVIYNFVSDVLCPGQIIEGYTKAGVYTDTFQSAIGCDSIRILSLLGGVAIQTEISRYICEGTSYEGHTHTGIYSDTFSSLSGCDSIRTLHLFSQACEPIVRYDLDICRSYMTDGSNMDYSEFTPVYPFQLSCSDISASTLYREQTIPQKHSCTPSFNGSTAMCISIDTSCNYIPGSPASLITEITLDPSTDSISGITGLQFFQRGPYQYTWIDGPSGPNDYATLFGIRVLRNGKEIYRKEAIPTSPEWKLVSFDFTGIDSFRIQKQTTFRIELLPYCPIGNGAEVKAWEVENVEVSGSCWPSFTQDIILKGTIKNISGSPISGVTLHVLPVDIHNSPKNGVTDPSGKYSINGLLNSEGCSVRGYLNTYPLQGVSTLDLVLLQQHLLGRKPFTSLDQYVAADADHNGNVNVLDLLAIQKAILGYSPAFPKNTSWRLGLWPQDFTENQLEDFREDATIESLVSENAIQDFVGIKVGDISGDASPNLNHVTKGPEIETVETCIIQMSKTDNESGMKNAIEFISGEDMDILGFQCALNFPTDNDISLEKESLPISGNDYTILDGVVRISWCNTIPKHILKGSVLWKIYYSKSRGLQMEFPDVSENELYPEAYTKDIQINRLAFEMINKNRPDTQNLFMQILPNPVHDEMHLMFEASSEGPVDIKIIDLSGKICYQKKYSIISAGNHEEIIDLSNVNLNSGLYLCSVLNDQNLMYKKFIVAR